MYGFFEWDLDARVFLVTACTIDTNKSSNRTSIWDELKLIFLSILLTLFSFQKAVRTLPFFLCFSVAPLIMRYDFFISNCSRIFFSFNHFISSSRGFFTARLLLLNISLRSCCFTMLKFTFKTFRRTDFIIGWARIAISEEMLQLI